jgi:PKD repeat protein
MNKNYNKIKTVHCSSEEEQYKLLKMIFSDEANNLQSAIEMMENMPASELDSLTEDLLKRGLLQYAPNNDLELTNNGIEFIRSWDNNIKSNGNLKKEEFRLGILKEKIQKWKEEGYNVDELEQMTKSVETPKSIKRKKEIKHKAKILLIFIFLVAIVSSVTLYISINKNPVVAEIYTSSTSGATPFVVHFTGSGNANNGIIESYYWDFGDGSTSNEQNPSHTYITPGAYSTVLTIRDNTGATNSKAITITSYANNVNFSEEVSEPSLLNNPPTASISASPIIGSAPLPVSFIGAGIDNDGYIYSYYWDFGDGSTNNKQNPSHTYTNPGIYTATLTITDNDGATDTKTIIITVQIENKPPTAYASANPSSGIAPLTLQFTGSGSDTDGFVVAYRWSFGDGFTSDLQNPSHVFTIPGKYIVTLTVTDNKGETGYNTLQIIVTQTNRPPNQPTNENPAHQEEWMDPDIGSLICTVSDPDKDNVDVSFYWEDETLIGTINGITNGGTASINIGTLNRYGAVGWYVIVNDGVYQTTGPTWSFTVEAYDWDINRDAKVDNTDTAAVELHYGESGDHGWIREDINNDGVVNYLDVSMLVSHYGETY